MTALVSLAIWGLKASVLLGVAGLATWVFRRAPAAHRHLVWATAVLAVLALPLVGVVTPAWRVTVPAEVAGLRPDISSADVTDIAAGPAAGAAVSAHTGVTEQTGDPASFEPRSPGRVATSPISTATILLAAWVLGALLVLLAVAGSLAATIRLARRARKAEGLVAATAEMLRHHLAIARRVRVLVSPDADMPVTWGAWRPVVLLPAEAAAWSAPRLRAVLAHELAHVARWDWLTQLAARLVCAAHWMNPLAWYAARRLRQERELACDDRVLSLGTPAGDYANDLLQIARGLRGGRITALAGVSMARPSQLAGRLLAVLDPTRARHAVTRRHAAPVAVVAVLVMLPVGAMQLAGSAPSAPTPPGRSLAEQPSVPQPLIRPVVQRGATLCDWDRPGDRSSSSTNINDGRMTIALGLDGCSLDIRARGQVEFTEDDRDVAALDPDGYLVMEERARDGARRRVEVERDGGSITRRWYVNGSERSWDRDAAAWFHGALLVMFRRTSFGAEERAARIYRMRGAEGLFAEAEQIHSGHALARYYGLLAREERLTPERVRRMAAGTARITSSSALGTILSTLVANPGTDDAARAEIVRASERISSSSQRRKVLVAAADRAPLTPGLADAIVHSASGISSSSARAAVLIAVGARLPEDRPLPPTYVDAAGDISSSSEKARVLEALLRRDRLSQARLAGVFELASTISSSSARARVLVTALERHRLEDPSRDAFFAAANGIGSSSERARVLLSVLRGRPDGQTMAAVLESAGGIGSSSSRADVLVEAARLGVVRNDALRALYRRVAEGIGSRSERARALAALGEREI